MHRLQILCISMFHSRSVCRWDSRIQSRCLLSNQTPHNIQGQSHIQTLIAECVCKQDNHNVQKLLQGGYRVQSLVLKLCFVLIIDKRKHSESGLYLFPSPACAHTHPSQSLLPPTQTKEPVWARRRQFSSHPEPPSTHMQVITLSSQVPHDTQAKCGDKIRCAMQHCGLVPWLIKHV